MRAFLPLLLVACTGSADPVLDDTDTPSNEPITEGIRACTVDVNFERYRQASVTVVLPDATTRQENVDDAGCAEFSLPGGTYQIQGKALDSTCESATETVVVVDGSVSSVQLNVNHRCPAT